MIYNASEFGPVPWETIIKDFRPTSQTHSTVEGHAQQFIDHLQKFKNYISEDHSAQLVITTRDKQLESLRNELAKEQGARTSDEWDAATVQEFISNYCQRHIEEIRGQCDQANLDDGNLRQAVEATVSDWNEHVRSALNLQHDSGVSEDLIGLVIEALKVVPLSDSYTGIVVAGFGQDQYFPALSHYIVDNVVGDEVKVCLKQTISVQGNGAGYVVPFAQQALPIAFLGGLPPDYLNAISSLVHDVIELTYGYLLDQVNDHLALIVHENVFGGGLVLVGVFGVGVGCRWGCLVRGWGLLGCCFGFVVGVGAREVGPPDGLWWRL